MGLNKKGILIFLSILIVFIGLHFFGLGQPYHQDEYKWVQYSHPEIVPPGTVPHPPLTEFIYTKIGPIVGDMNFRVIPFIFGIFNFFLLFYLVKYLFDKKTAFIAITIFTFSFYSLLASLMVDVDGAVMPFFLLLLSIGYFKWKNRSFIFEKESYKWIILLLVGAIGGFLIKLSAVLPLFAFAFDFAIEKRVFADKKRLLKYAGGVLLGIAALVIILIGSKLIFPFFNLSYSLKYWEHFENSSSFLGRGWLQTFIQCIKSILFASPLLIFAPFLLKRTEVSKLRPYFVFLIFAFIFYIILFDFSIGALDRYWQLLVVPLSIFVSVVISRIFEIEDLKTKKTVIFSVLFSLLIISTQFLVQYVPPLYPKTEWINRILGLNWTFVYPFSGGSGPLGFYVSFLTMALCWVLSFIALIFTIFKPKHRKLALIFMVIVGFFYNLLFIEEYLFGFFNGSASKLVLHTTEFIKNNPDIKMVTVYNDNGGYNIQAINKYRRRLYIDPKFDLNVKIDTLNRYKEHYMVVDAPHIDSNSPYQKYFNSCKVIYDERDKYISSKIYDCTNAPDFKI
jgi:hypothetical protein